MLETTTEVRLNVAKEFSRTPGPRSPDEGKYSGKEFLDTLLRKRFLQAVERGTSLHIILDGTAGYASSFLESAFGGLAREYEPAVVLRTLGFTSDEEPYLVDEIREYIEGARDQ